MSKNKPQLHTHPNPRLPAVYGIRLKPGDVIEPGDVYASSSGGWEPAPCPGVVLQEGVETVWVRETLRGAIIIDKQTAEE